MREQILVLITLASSTLLGVSEVTGPLVSPLPDTKPQKVVVLASHSLDLTTRQPNSYANLVFADNILLALHYLKGDVENLKLEAKKSGPANIDWEAVRQPFEVSFTLKPGEIFAFHQNVLPEFDPSSGGPIVTMNSRFLIEEGYKSVGGLGGNGVCHLASLINWVASEARLAEDGESKRAGLKATSMVDHNFAPVPGVPSEYGASIRSQNPTQNLYIKNNFDFPVEFEFKNDEETIILTILNGGED